MVASRVIHSRDKKGQRTWDIWCSFCTSINIHPDILTLADPVPILQTFSLRWWDGRIAPSGNPNRARSVEDATWLVSQKLSLLEDKDPRLDSTGNQDFRLRHMYSAWKKLDNPPAARVEPVPIIILLRAAALCTSSCNRDNTTIDCIWMAFYFLLCPGEYANASGKIGQLHFFMPISQPFNSVLQVRLHFHFIFICANRSTSKWRAINKNENCTSSFIWNLCVQKRSPPYYNLHLGRTHDVKWVVYTTFDLKYSFRHCFIMFLFTFLRISWHLKWMSK